MTQPDFIKIFLLRQPYHECKFDKGYVIEKRGQKLAYCFKCNEYIYSIPKQEQIEKGLI